MSKIQDTIREVLALDEKATKGPWFRAKYYPGISGNVSDDEVCSLLVGNQNFPGDAAINEEMVMHYRTSAPLLARELKKHREALRVAREALQEVSLYLGQVTPEDGKLALTIAPIVRGRLEELPSILSDPSVKEGGDEATKMG